ncbi:MAG: hypothetical protein FWE64_02330 [Alphaproteobacteria bacterium]|nr:hypothetical protein [Alphaproteobacteria bacterium]
MNMIRDRCRVHAPSTNDADQDTADGRRWQVEQDIAQALAISRYVPSGHGAFARVITVRATWAWVGSTASGIDIQNSGEEILVCKEGFRPNTSRTDCEMINPALCTRARCDNPADCDTFDRERIYFGPGRTQTPITDQCWQRMDATEFVTCVRGS